MLVLLLDATDENRKYRDKEEAELIERPTCERERN